MVDHITARAPRRFASDLFALSIESHSNWDWTNRIDEHESRTGPIFTGFVRG